MGTMLKWFDRHVFLGIRDHWKTQKRLSDKINASESAYESEFDDLVPIVSQLSQSAIYRHLDAAELRLRSIEDKAKANLLGMTLGVAVLFAGLNLTASGGLATLTDGWIRNSCLTLFFLAVGYLLVGGWMALEALRLRPVYLPSIRNEADFEKKFRAIPAVWAMEQNDRTAWMRANALSVSFGGIRNGVVCLAVAGFLLAAAIALADPYPPRQQPIGDPVNEVTLEILPRTDSAPGSRDLEAAFPPDSTSTVQDSTPAPEASGEVK